MSIPATAVRYTIQAQAPQGEIAAVNLWTMGREVGSQADANLLASSMAATIEAHLTAWNQTIANDTEWNQVTAYCYPAGGTVAGFIGQSTVEAPGLSTAGMMPLQTCLVVTLLTGNAGRSYRGRLYLPATCVTVMQGTHQLAGNTVDNLAGDWASFLEAVDFNNCGKPSVVSPTRTSATAISALAIDTRLDVQRRRANKQSVTHRATEDVTYA